MSETYDVVIAEDETVQLRSLSAMVTASDLPFRVVGMAQDGDEAIAFIKQLKPQLVIVDIQMPRCSGLEVLKYIAEHKLGITSIVISGFTAFEYAQEALRYGAGEYLLKPVTRAQLFNTLQVFLTRFRDNGRTGERFSLHRMLSGAPTELPGACSHFFLMLVSIGNYPYSVAAPEMAEINLSRMAMQSAERLLQVDEQFFMTRGPAVGQIYCLFGIQCEGRAERICTAMFKELKAIVQAHEPRLTLSVTVSRFITSDNLSTEQARLTDNLKHIAVFERDAFVGFGENIARHSIQDTLNQSAMLADQLVQSLQKKDARQFETVLSMELSYWEITGCTTATMLGILKFQYLSMTKAVLRAGQGAVTPLWTDWENNLDDAFSTSLTWTQLLAKLIDLFFAIHTEVSNLSGSEAIVDKIDRYLRDNYAEHITNQTLSKAFGFVPSYISKLFRAYRGISPSDQLTQIRIEKAKELIRFNSSLNLSDIATAVGFSDPSYFSRLFKRMEGVLPTEYREGMP